MTTPGNALNNEIMALIKLTGKVSIMWRQNSRKIKLGGHLYTFGYKGCGDICGMFKGGRHFQFEGKAGNDKPSQDQIDNVAQINKDGGLAAIIYNVEQLRDILKENGYL
jgi:hypothetical protein